MFIVFAGEQVDLSEVSIHVIGALLKVSKIEVYRQYQCGMTLSRV